MDGLVGVPKMSQPLKPTDDSSLGAPIRALLKGMQSCNRSVKWGSTSIARQGARRLVSTANEHGMREGRRSHRENGMPPASRDRSTSPSTISLAPSEHAVSIVASSVGSGALEDTAAARAADVTPMVTPVAHKKKTSMFDSVAVL